MFRAWGFEFRLSGRFGADMGSEIPKTLEALRSWEWELAVASKPTGNSLNLAHFSGPV